MNRVVITGMGIYSCIGKNLAEVRQSLYQGKSGIGFDPERKAVGFRSGLTGIIERPQLKGKLDRRSRIGLAEMGEYAYLSTQEAIEQARLDIGYFESHEAGVLFGNDSSAKAVIETNDLLRVKKDTTLLGSGSIFQSMNSTVNMNMATIFKLRGINFSVSAACASGSHAIGLGYLFIKEGYQDMVVCGGAQEINWMSMSSFDGLSAFSVREDEPSKASRPFDASRDGLVPSGGGATLILESLESARKRNAPILGEIIGYGFSSNGDHISNPNVDGPYRSLMRAMNQAGIHSADLDYINAHATSTPNGDTYEARAIKRLCGDAKPFVSSTKSMTGHECWMAGASEVVYCLLMMRDSFIAPNINFETPDEDSAKLNIAAKTIDRNLDIVLSNSFGFGGTNSTIILKKFKT